MRTAFNEIGFTAEKSGKCFCGKRRIRRKRFWQTESRFNRMPDGTVKTREQIMADLNAEEAAWRKEPIGCAGCAPAKSLTPTL